MAIAIILILVLFAAALCGILRNHDNSASNSDSKDTKTVTMRCPNCGATITLQAGASSWDCPWCGDCGMCQ